MAALRSSNKRPMTVNSKAPTTLLCVRERSHLHDGPLIRLPCPQNIIHHRKQNHRPRHQNTEVHMRGRNRRRNRPKAKKENDDPKPHRPSIDHDTKNARKMERSPDELVSFACIIRDICRFANSACAPTPEEKALCDDVRGVETAYA